MLFGLDTHKAWLLLIGWNWIICNIFLPLFHVQFKLIVRSCSFWFFPGHFCNKWFRSLLFVFCKTQYSHQIRSSLSKCTQAKIDSTPLFQDANQQILQIWELSMKKRRWLDSNTNNYLKRYLQFVLFNWVFNQRFCMNFSKNTHDLHCLI